jgi:hypothetical protein
MIYDTKKTFLAIGVEPVTTSSYAVEIDCEICLKPLAMIPDASSTHQNGDSSTKPADLTPLASTPTKEPTFHPALRIIACGHVHGAECLTAWLETGNTCPTCACILFTPPSEQPISQEEVNWVVAILEPLIGEELLYRWIAKYMASGMEEEVRRKRAHDNMVVVERIAREQKERIEREMYTLGDEDFMEEEYEEWSDEEGEADEDGEDAQWSGEEAAGDADVENAAVHEKDLLE